MSSLSSFFWALGLLSAGAVLPLAAGRGNRAAHSLGAVSCFGGAAAGIIAAVQGFIAGGAGQARLFWAAANLPLTLRLDGLAHFFLLPVFLIVAVSSVYAVRYLDPPRQGLQAARHWAAFNILAASMALVIAAADSLTFLIAWELMSLSSFLLVVYDLQNEQARRAGLLYLIATHLGTLFLFLFFLEGYRRTGSLEFASLKILHELPLRESIIFFFLALAGFGTKAGLFPLHSWLPEAHSAAPSHVSALMSGVMIKTAIYTFLRMVTYLPPLPSWCGLLVAVLGLTGGLFGIALASMQTDLKRSLAYSTVENIGIIFLGLGLWLYCGSAGYSLAGHFLLAGALLHVWNHALFKSLLFLGAGSVLHAAGTREMSALGGLLRRMPFTGTLMICGAAAISALPPLNGFVSELLIYLGLFQAGQAADGGEAFLFMLFAILLAMIGGLVALAMTRIIGIVFSGEPRTPKPGIHEAAPSMIAAMAAVALCCLAVGVMPQLILPLLDAPLALLAPASPGVETAFPLPFGPAWSLGALLLGGAVVIFIIVSQRRQTLPEKKAIGTWGCGFTKPGPRLSYTAGSYGQFAQDEMYCSCLRPQQPQERKTLLFPAAMRFQVRAGDPVLERWFSPLFRRSAEVAYFFRGLQAGRLNIYLAYVFLTTILLLGWSYFLP